jgi:hypothetical protein
MKDTLWILLACIVIVVVALYCAAWALSQFLGKLVHQ